ncbi:MAG: DUF4160 domain-containing protein [Chloroflexi bacterium]|nr:DUF4160 domain-containing protein [Chloroflexota bacterium]
MVFYANGGNEPTHVHVRRDRRVAKFWLRPLRLAQTGSMPRHEINRIRVMVEDHEAFVLERWNEFFNV